MIEWYENLTPFLQTVFIIACVATLVMIVQLVMLMIGFGVDHDFDADVPDDLSEGDVFNNDGFLDLFGLKILTIRNLFVFLAMGGWSILVMHDLTNILWLSIVIGIIVGAVMVFLVSYAMKKALSLQNDGNIDINNAVGKTGSVYLTIPSKKSGFGKVNILIQERLQEFEAMTDDENAIPTGVDVEIIKVEVNYLLVRRKSN